MNNSSINQVVILGGGTAGWMAAASLVRYFEGQDAQITLVESEDIGTVGVGEATIPSIRQFNASLGIDEREFIRATNATFKLGIEFRDWRRGDDHFFHPFADFGQPLNGVDFHHYLQRLERAGEDVALEDYCFAVQLARRGHFAQPHPEPPTPLADFGYAYHFDASLYARFLRGYAEQRGVIRREGKVAQVPLCPQTGDIQALHMEQGEPVTGQLFIDCSGFRGLLIEGAMGVKQHDWHHWLPCDSAVAVQSDTLEEPPPFTRCTALEAGWQWRIPLQHRTGNGYVYASDFIEPEAAERQLLQNLNSEPVSPAKHFRFVTGPRAEVWHKNCFALGLASGFLEPLESTSISLIQTGIGKLLQFFPLGEFSQHDRDEVNRQHHHEFERIRDFLVLHYHLTERTDSPFWRHCRDMEVPPTLAHKLALFRRRGHRVEWPPEAFEPDSWLAIYKGMGVQPEHYDPRADWLDAQQLQQRLQQMRSVIAEAADQAAGHGEFIARNCRGND